MFILKTSILCLALAYVTAQQYNQPTTTPVPILKQINRQNDDGSYSYGYEAADGSFKIETKYPNGDVAGKYGYVDESGKQREISYGASSKRGFEPQGNGIMVPPPTLNDSPSNALTDGQEDDGQYREDPKIYEDPKYNKASRTSSQRQFHQPAQKQTFQFQNEQAYQPQQYQQPQQPQQYQTQQEYQPQTQFRSSPLFSQQTNLFNQAPQQFSQPQRQNFIEQEFRPQSQVYHQQPQFSYQAYTPQYNQQYNNYPQNFNPFAGHPAQNFDPNTGSYSINFTGK